MTSSPSPAPAYTAADFQLAADCEECDLVLKGGVTSGVVYPYAILEVAKKYRLRSIGGASAGAIAAGFAAAAEFARRNGDAVGYVRLGERCSTLPAILLSLFQPAPRLRPIFRLALAATAKKAKGWRLFWAVRHMLFTGLGLGAALYAAGLGLAWTFGLKDVWSTTALPGLAFALLLGAAVYVLLTLKHLLGVDLPANRFGLCSGLRQKGFKGPAMTEWLHQAIQHIAFEKPPGRPLTFGDLEGPAGGPHGIDFRAMTTNLSMQRPEVIPRTRLDLYFDVKAWRSLFPAEVMAYLEGEGPDKAPIAPKHPTQPHLRKLPAAETLPILIGIRMSLSFPLLIQAIPMQVDDIGARVRGELASGAVTPVKTVWFSDGGITSNFPVHFFDALLPSRPTFAFSLDELDEGRGKDERISMPQGADQGVFLPIHEVKGLGGFAGSILGAAKDWQDQMQSVLPGQRQRVVRIKLVKSEGGLNLDMPPEVSQMLMGLGQKAGEKIRSEFNFGEHRWRRALVAYEQLEVLTDSLRKVWPGYSTWYRANVKTFEAYGSFDRNDKVEIADRIDCLVEAAECMHPKVQGKYPRPTGRLRTVPEL